MFYIYCMISIMLIEMFNLFEIEFIYNLAIFVYFNDLIGRKKVVAISIFEIVLTYYNNKWRHCPTIRIYILDHSNLFSIVKLYNFNFLTPVVRRYNKDGYDLAYKKACLVEILNIGLYNIIFNNNILEKSKPSFNNL